MFDDETVDYFVVVNGEDQYSIWPAQRELPKGWRADGPARSREQCLSYIEKTWTDMTPRSVREAIAVGERAVPASRTTVIHQPLVPSAPAVGGRMILSQLVDADEMMAMSPDELREMLIQLDGEIVNGDGEILAAAKKSEPADAEAHATTDAS